MKTNNVNVLQAINTNGVAVNVYGQPEVDTGLNLKAGKFNNYPKADINLALGMLRTGIDNRV